MERGERRTVLSDRVTGHAVRRVLGACFFLSGFSALVYEVVWMRLFTPAFGNTAYSAAAVLAAYMLGLGVGGRWAGRRAKGRAESVRLYGIVEIAVAVYAPLTLLAARGFESVYPALYGALDGSAPSLLAVKSAAAVFFLFLPTFCMGATLPLVTNFFAGTREVFGRAVSGLYSLNTAGAVSGTLLAGFVLIRYHGLRNTLLIASCVSAAAGLLALAQYWKVKDVSIGAAIDPEKGSESGPAGSGSAWPVLAGVFGSGFAAMALEVAWTRALALIIGGTTYAFTLMLATFLAGTALGGMCAWVLMRFASGRVRGGTLAMLYTGAAALAWAAMPAMERTLVWFGTSLGYESPDYSAIVLWQFAACSVVMLVPAMVLGAAFPVAAEVYSKKTGEMAGGLGRVYWWNMAGAVSGALAGGLVLMPRVGIKGVVAAGAFTLLAVSLPLSADVEKGRRLLRFAAACVLCAGIALGIFRTGWDGKLMSSGPLYRFESMAPVRSGDDLRGVVMRDYELVYYADGISGTVTVRDYGDRLGMQINGKTNASSRGDVQTQLGLGLLPLLLMPGDPKDVAVIGLGSGMTAGAVLQVPGVRRVDVVEVEPRVVEAAELFEAYNFGVMEDPRTNIYVDDGRNFLLGVDKKYDVIVSEPSHHWNAGIGALYTREFYEMAAARLNEGGLFSQWVQGYSLTAGTMGTILATFRSAFPWAHVFQFGADFVLIGSVSPLDMDALQASHRFKETGIGKRAEELGAKFRPYGIIAGYYAAGPDEIKSLERDEVLNTDDRPVLEFAAPFEMFATPLELAEALLTAYSSDVPERLGLEKLNLTETEWFSIALEHIATPGGSPRAVQFALKSLDIDPGYAPALIFLSEYYISTGELGEAEVYFNRAVAAGVTKEQLSTMILPPGTGP